MSTDATTTIQWLQPSDTAAADLAVVIVNWNVKELLAKNVESVLQSLGTSRVRLIVVDNGSSDGSVEMLRARFPQVMVIANTQNLGFAKAVNQGIAADHARHVLLLNPDMQVTPDAFQRTIDELDADSTIGVLGGKLSSADGSAMPSVRRLPDIWSQLLILLKVQHFFPNVNKRYMYTDFDYSKLQDAPSVRGSYFAMSHTALEKLGGLDERYFIWFEEVDYCAQVLKAGLRIVFDPAIRAQDLVGRSFAQRKRLWKQKQFSRSMQQYFAKWHPGWQAWLISFCRPFVIAGAWLLDLI